MSSLLLPAQQLITDMQGINQNSMRMKVGVYIGSVRVIKGTKSQLFVFLLGSDRKEHGKSIKKSLPGGGALLTEEIRSRVAKYGWEKFDNPHDLRGDILVRLTKSDPNWTRTKFSTDKLVHYLKEIMLGSHGYESMFAETVDETPAMHPLLNKKNLALQNQSVRVTTTQKDVGHTQGPLLRVQVTVGNNYELLVKGKTTLYKLLKDGTDGLKALSRDEFKEGEMDGFPISDNAQDQVRYLLSEQGLKLPKWRKNGKYL